MSLFKRIQKLWELSGEDFYVPSDWGTEQAKSKPFWRRKKLASVVDMDDPLKIDLGEEI